MRHVSSLGDCRRCVEGGRCRLAVLVQTLDDLHGWKVSVLAPSDKKAKGVLGMHADGLSYRLIARNVGMSKNTVMDIVRRNTTSAEALR